MKTEGSNFHSWRGRLLTGRGISRLQESIVNVVVQVDQITRVDVVLQVGDIAQK